MEVSLASQAHQVPQVGWPHKAPVIIARHVNNNPIGAIDLLISKKLLILKMKLSIDKIAINEKHAKPIQADGTWTYIILTESPWI